MYFFRFVIFCYVVVKMSNYDRFIDNNVDWCLYCCDEEGWVFCEERDNKYEQFMFYVEVYVKFQGGIVKIYYRFNVLEIQCVCVIFGDKMFVDIDGKFCFFVFFCEKLIKCYDVVCLELGKKLCWFKEKFQEKLCFWCKEILLEMFGFDEEKCNGWVDEMMILLVFQMFLVKIFCCDYKCYYEVGEDIFGIVYCYYGLGF